MGVVRAPRTATVNLYQGDDYERLAEAYQALQVAKAESGDDGKSDRIGDSASVAEKRATYEQVRDEVSRDGTEVRMRAVSRTKWRNLLAGHKPRPDDKADESAGFNRDTFPAAVVDLCLVEMHVGDELVRLSGSEREEWLDDLTQGEELALFEAAFGLNENRPLDPKALSLAGR